MTTFTYTQAEVQAMFAALGKIADSNPPFGHTLHTPEVESAIAVYQAIVTGQFSPSRLCDMCNEPHAMELVGNHWYCRECLRELDYHDE